jgi:transcriptional regulator with XRE-family HTH domain
LTTRDNPSTSSISQRKQVGAALRSYRLEIGLDRDEAARLLDVSPATLGRIERGETRLQRQDLQILAEAYRIPEPEREALQELLRSARARRTEYPAFVSVRTRSAVDMETDASEILYSLIDLVPAHFQTEAYMRALWVASGQAPTPEHVDRLVAARVARQAILTQDKPPMVRAIIHENALRLPVGGPRVMHDQLLHLAALTERPNVEIQIQPVSAGAHPGIGKGFMLLRFDNNTAADLVQVEAYGDSFYRDRTGTTEPYRTGWDRQRVSALSLPDSKALILSAAADMERQTEQ